MSIFPLAGTKVSFALTYVHFLFMPFHSVRAQMRCRAQSPDSGVLDAGNPGPTLWVINRDGGRGPGSVCFLQRPEGELQSSSSWPLHHCPDTDRLHLLGFLTPSRPAPFLSSSRFGTLSIPPNSIFPSFLLLFSACCYLGFALQELIKSMSFDPFLMSGLWFFLFSTLVLYNTFIHLLPASPHPVTWHYVEETPQTNISTLHIPSLIPRSFLLPPLFFFFLPSHSLILLAPKTLPETLSS